MRIATAIAAFLTSLVAAGFASAQDTAALTPAPGSVRLIVSLTWEGRDLQAHNVDALTAFRTAHPELPLAHFVSPAYFLKQDIDPAKAAATIRGTMREGDRIG